MASTYLEQQIAGAQTETPLDPRFREIVNFYAEEAEGQTLLESEVQARIQELSDRNATRQAEAALALEQPDFESLGAAAQRYGSPPSADEAAAAAVADLASTEDLDRRQALAASQEELRLEREARFDENVNRLRERIKEIDAERIREGSASVLGRPNAGLSAWNYAQTTIMDFVDTMIPGGTYTDLVNAISDADPSLHESLVDYVHPEDIKARLPALIDRLPPEKADEVMDRLIAGIRSRAGNIRWDNRLAEKNLVQSILDTFERHGRGEKGRLDNWLAPLDYAFVMPEVGGLAKGAAKALAKTGFGQGIKLGANLSSAWSIPQTSIAAQLSKTQRGADKLAQTVTRPGAPTESLGVDAGQAAATLFAPKPAIKPRFTLLEPGTPSVSATPPKELAGATPRFNVGQSSFTPSFESDVDKALFIVAQSRKSKANDKYMDFLRGVGLSDEQITTGAKTVKDALRKAAKATKEGDEIRLPQTIAIPARAARKPRVRLIAAGQRGSAGVGSATTTSGAPGAAQAATAPLVSLPESGVPYLPHWLLTDSERAGVAANVQGGLKQAFQLRLNSTRLEFTPDGLKATATIGDGRGVGWTDPADAHAWAQANLTPAGQTWRVERDAAGGHQVVFDRLYGYGDKDLEGFTDVVTGNLLKLPVLGLRLSGRDSFLGKGYATASKEAQAITAKAIHVNQKMMRAFSRLGPKLSAATQKLLLQGEANFVEYTAQDLLNKGTPEKVINAYLGVRRLARKNWALSDQMMRQHLVAKGFDKYLDIGGEKVFASAIEFSAMRGDALSAKAVDLITGTAVDLGGLARSKYQVYKFFTPTSKAYRYGVVELTQAGRAKVSPLPDTVLQYVDGWLPRHYQAPYIIREEIEPGVTRAYATARSKGSALRGVKELRAANPGRKFIPVPADEIAEETQSIGDIAMLVEQGMLVTNPRRPVPLLDVDGGTAMMSVPDSIHRLATSTATMEGIGKFTQSMAQRFDATYGSTLGFTLNMAKAPTRPRNVELQGLYDEAIQVYDYIRLLNGLHPSGAVGDVLRGTKIQAADLLYNWASYTRDFGGFKTRTAVQAAGGAIGGAIDSGDETRLEGIAAGVVAGTLGVRSAGTLRYMADNLSGLNPTIQSQVKSAAFTAYLALNPLVQLPLQAAMLPIHTLTVKGGMTYALSGRMLVDNLILMFSTDPAKVRHVLRAAGLKWDYAAKLIDDFNRSGLPEMVDEHIMAASTLGDSRLATASNTRRAAAAVFQGARRIGFDVGIGIEKKHAWLLARNRALGEGRRLNELELQRVAHEAEDIVGALNRADSMYTANSFASIWLQFMSFPLKFSGRLLGGTLGTAVDVASGGKVRLFREHSLSRAEQFKAGVAGTLLFGTAGFGVSEMVGKLNDRYKWNLSEEQKLVLQEGIMGFMVNSLFRMAENPPEEDEADEDYQKRIVKVMFSERVSPFTMPGVLLTNARDIGKMMLEGDFHQVAEKLPSAAGLGFVGEMVNVAKFWYTLAGATDLPPADEAAIVMKEFLSKFPLTNNFMKHHMATNLKTKFDSRGGPIMEATNGMALAALWGLRDYREEAIRVGNELLSGPYSGMDDEAIAENIRAAADATWFGWMQKTLTYMGNGEIVPEDGAKLLESHNITFRTGLKPEEYAAYRNALARRILQHGVTKEDKFLARLAEAPLARGAPITQSFEEKLLGLDHPKSNDIVLNMRGMFAPLSEDMGE